MFVSRFPVASSLLSLIPSFRSDLFVGFLYYRDRINLLTGWVLHIAYITLMEYVIHWNWSHLFLLSAFMEVPTFILSISYLIPNIRHDIIFAAIFFTTRI